MNRKIIIMACIGTMSVIGMAAISLKIKPAHSAHFKQVQVHKKLL